MSKFALIKAYHDGERPVLVGRDLETNKKGQFTIPGFVPYFFIENDPNGLYRSVEGKKLSRITCTRPGNVPAERAKYPKTWEADIPFARRFLVDKKIKAYFKVEGTEIIGDGDPRFDD